MNRPTAFALTLTASLVAFTGCETTGKSALDANFGNAYRNMVASQIHNPEAARMPPQDPPMTMDGQRGSNVIEAYRVDGKQKGAPQPAISIKLGK